MSIDIYVKLLCVCSPDLIDHSKWKWKPGVLCSESRGSGTGAFFWTQIQRKRELFWFILFLFILFWFTLFWFTLFHSSFFILPFFIHPLLIHPFLIHPFLIHPFLFILFILPFFIHPFLSGFEETTVCVYGEWTWF